MSEEKKKKGLFSAVKESMNKSGGCCGPGETCGGTATKESEKSEVKKKAPPSH